MTPIQTMNKFEERYQYIDETYLEMQRAYVAKRVEHKLFTTSRHVASSSLVAHTEFSESEYKVDDMKLLGIRLFGNWRNSLSIFRLNDDLAGEVIHSDIPSLISSDLLKNMPEWCVYIEMPRQARSVFAKSLVDEDALVLLGFWATYDSHASGAHKGEHLSLFLHVDDNGVRETDLSLLKPVTLPIGNITIAQSINQAWGYQGCAFTEKLAGNHGALQVMVSILLCLCVDEPDVVDVIGLSLTRKQLDKPKYKHVKKTNVFTPAAQPHYHEIGKVTGKQLQSAKRELENELAATDDSIRSYLQHGCWQVQDWGDKQTYWQPAEHIRD